MLPSAGWPKGLKRSKIQNWRQYRLAQTQNRSMYSPRNVPGLKNVQNVNGTGVKFCSGLSLEIRKSCGHSGVKFWIVAGRAPAPQITSPQSGKVAGWSTAPQFIYMSKSNEVKWSQKCRTNQKSCGHTGVKLWIIAGQLQPNLERWRDEPLPHSCSSRRTMLGSSSPDDLKLSRSAHIEHTFVTDLYSQNPVGITIGNKHLSPFWHQ